MICEWGAMRDERVEDAAGGGGRALCATGVDVDGVVVAFIFDAFSSKRLDYVSIPSLLTCIKSHTCIVLVTTSMLLPGRH